MNASKTRAKMMMPGQPSLMSRWFDVDQAKIDKFADLTEDWQFIHIDPEKAAETPFGGTIAHGFLTLSLLTAMAYDALPPVEGRTAAINYGFEKIRFLSPVRSGSRLRATFSLLDATVRNASELMTKYDVQVEIEGQAKPALAAEWLSVSYFAAETSVE